MPLKLTCNAGCTKTILNGEQAENTLREAWEHESSKDEMNIVLRGLERHYWRGGTEAGWLGCYDFPGETWAGDGSVHKCVMGAGSVCLQRPGCNLVVRVGREEEGVSSLRPELAAIARTLQAAPAESDLLYLCDSEAALGISLFRVFRFFSPYLHPYVPSIWTPLSLSNKDLSLYLEGY